MYKHLGPAFSLLTLLVGLQAPASPLLCKNVFQIETNLEPRLDDSKALKTNFDLAYQKSEQVQGVSRTSGTLRTFSHYHQTLEGEMIRTDLFDFLPSKVSTPGSSKYIRLIEQNINFVIDQYQQRRDWQPDYLKSIRDDAYAYAEKATYIVAIRQKTTALDGAGDIIGTMKVIAGDHKNRLPFEIDHNIEVPLNGGRKFEPGNFVVLKEESALAFGEVMSHFVRFAKELQKNSSHNPNQMIFFTDADRASAMMYRQLGFSTVPGFEAPLVKNGKEYYLIGASTNTILKFPSVLEAKRSEWVKDGALETFTRIPGRMPLQDQSMNFKHLRIKTLYDYKYTAQDFKVLHQGGMQVYWATNHLGERNLTLRRDHGLGKFYFNLSLKASELPLKEGHVRKELIDKDLSLEISYREGLLKVLLHDSHKTTRLLMETNSDFSDVRGIKFEKFSDGESDLEISTLAAPDIRTFP